MFGFVPSFSFHLPIVGDSFQSARLQHICVCKLHCLTPSGHSRTSLPSYNKCSSHWRKGKINCGFKVHKVLCSSENCETREQHHVFLIDALALIYRSHFALSRSGLRTSYGLETGPIYGFISTLLSLLETYRPSCIMVVFDSYYFPQDNFTQPTPWQRRLIYPDYKKNRSKMPTAIEKSLPYIKALVSALGISIIEVASTEADDVIGSLVKYCTSNSFVAKIVSADKDFLQLLQGSTCVILRPRTNKYSKKTPQHDTDCLPGWSLITETEFRETYDNLSPLQYCDVLALMGDNADNIPGVAGIGEKQAVALLKSFGSIESLVENWKAISSSRLREKIFHHRELLLLSKKLVTIHQDVIIPNFEINDLFVRPPQLDKLSYIIGKLEIKKLRERAEKYFESSWRATESLYRTQRAPNVQNVLLQGKEHDIFDSDSESNSLYFIRMKRIESLGFQYFYLSTLVECNLAEEKWEELLLRIRKENVDVPFITFWTDYDMEPGETKKHKPHIERTCLNSCSPLVFLEGMWKKLLNEQLSFQDIIMIKGVAISWEDSSSIYLDLNNTKDAWIQQLEWLLGHSQMSKVSVFVKKQIHILQRYSHNLSVRSPFVDILVGHSATAPFESLSVEQVMKRFALLSGDHNMLDILEFIFSKKKDEILNSIDSSKLLSRLLCQTEIDSLHFAELLRVWCQCNWSILLFRAAKVLNSELMMLSMKTFVEYIEYPMIHVLATMERNGLCLNTKDLMNWTHKANLATSHHTTGNQWNNKLEKFNDNSLRVIPSGCQESPTILGRKYLNLLQRHMDPISGKLHIHYCKNTRLFGKLTTSHMDLEELFKEDTMKSLVVAPRGFQILVADWSQLEMRILAALSKEISWIQEFLKGGDIHKFIANKLLISDNNKELLDQQFREYAKILSYSVIRGTSERMISRELQVPQHSIKSWMELYHSNFPKVLKFLEENSEKSFQRGYSETLLGRKIPIPFKDSQNDKEISAAKNICRRAVIQGTQADIISLAMIRILEKLGQYPQSDLILQVGDHMIFQVSQSACEQVMKLVKKEVSDILPLPQNVPIQVRFGIGNDWLQATRTIQ
ncbi:hypothetical protein GpartN1_g2190.t1 [Galdieria partita]|uniref:DNA-directed DNA polymerase n=1 Tax=Galdieria partita TaxID=83374 RepID=A0A9C7PUE9_9RHOD|nr:hypothetical protein GpartN1_g2190.t1 [Galdieria partita]